MINRTIIKIKHEDITKIVANYCIRDIQAYYDKFNESVGQLDLAEKDLLLEYERLNSRLYYHPNESE